MDWLVSPDAWAALLTLTALEIVLGIDNLIFISILVDRLPPERRSLARRLGLGLAVITRILLLFCLSWLIGLTSPLFSVFHHPVSGRDLILLAGGLFLLAKSTHEIHHKLEKEQGHAKARIPASFAGVIAQVLALDIVFSLDSVITAVGMASHLTIMVTAILISVAIMLAAASWIGEFVNRHPSVKMLALSFLLLVGVSLVAEAFHHHIPKGYIYFSMAFSAMVEGLNLKAGSRAEPVVLREPYTRE